MYKEDTYYMSLSIAVMLPLLSQSSSILDTIYLSHSKTGPHGHRGDSVLNSNQSQPCLVIVSRLVI